jgi:hypothetical protein
MNTTLYAKVSKRRMTLTAGYSVKIQKVSMSLERHIPKNRLNLKNSKILHCVRPQKFRNYRLISGTSRSADFITAFWHDKPRTIKLLRKNKKGHRKYCGPLKR